MTVIGIDIGGTTVKLGAVENSEAIVYRDTRPSPHEPEQMTRLLAQMIRTARERFPGAPAGISTAGAIDAAGYIDANQLNFWHAPIGPRLRELLGESVPIENDGVCAMLAEYAAGALRGCACGVMITLGTGLGGGVMVNGRVLRGHGGAHAELGHMITHVDGEKCSCGQTGCWECYASASALSRMAGGMPPRDVVAAVRRGEMADVWRRYLHEVAQGLIGLCSIFAPEVIAVGGGLSGAQIVVDGIRDAVERDPGYRQYYSYARIVSARFGNDAGILGAAELAVRKGQRE